MFFWCFLLSLFLDLLSSIINCDLNFNDSSVTRRNKILMGVIFIICLVPHFNYKISGVNIILGAKYTLIIPGTKISAILKKTPRVRAYVYCIQVCVLNPLILCVSVTTCKLQKRTIESIIVCILPKVPEKPSFVRYFFFVNKSNNES